MFWFPYLQCVFHVDQQSSVWIHLQSQQAHLYWYFTDTLFFVRVLWRKKNSMKKSVIFFFKYWSAFTTLFFSLRNRRFLLAEVSCFSSSWKSFRNWYFPPKKMSRFFKTSFSKNCSEKSQFEKHYSNSYNIRDIVHSVGSRGWCWLVRPQALSSALTVDPHFSARIQVVVSRSEINHWQRINRYSDCTVWYALHVGILNAGSFSPYSNRRKVVHDKLLVTHTSGSLHVVKMHSTPGFMQWWEDVSTWRQRTFGKHS